MIHEENNVVNQGGMSIHLPFADKLLKLSAVSRHNIAMLMPVQCRSIQLQVIVELFLASLRSTMKLPKHHRNHGELHGIEPLQPKISVIVEGMKTLDGHLLGNGFRGTHAVHTTGNFTRQPFTISAGQRLRPFPWCKSRGPNALVRG